MSRTHYTFVRNQHYTTGRVATVDGHNERTNDNPLNCDIHEERRHLNVHFRRCLKEDGTPESYNESINRLLENRTIVKYNFKPKSAIIDELVYDVNTEYFDERGGYDFAVKFYEEVYRCAVKEVGGEQYILSAVLHADERNKGLSDKLGHDAWHYHLHVVYVPVIEGREIKYTARAGKELQGKVKEVITQINHTDKWPRKKIGKGYFNEYSRLQDRYFEHMRAAGYHELQRGEVGSTAEHLETLDYKIQQDEKRLDDLSTQMELTAEQIAMANEDLKKKTAQAEKKAAELEKLNKEVAVKTTAKVTLKEIDAMGHSVPLLPGVHFTNEEAEKLKALAKKSVTADDRIAASKKKMAAVEEQLAAVESKLRDAKIEANHWHRELTDLKNEVKDYLRLVKSFPLRVREFFAGLSREEQDNRQEQERQAKITPQQATAIPQQHKKSYDRGL